jgi:uncharacterized protein YfbU (UPF0304 family)
MKIVYVFLEFLSNQLEIMEDLDKKNVNKHYKRLVRILKKLAIHLQGEMSWNSIAQFQPEFIPNKAKYGQKIKTPLYHETNTVLNVIIEDCKIHIIEFQKKEMFLEVHIMNFIQKSCQSVLNGTFCLDQKVLLKELTSQPSLVAASA